MGYDSRDGGSDGKLKGVSAAETFEILTTQSTFFNDMVLFDRVFLTTSYHPRKHVVSNDYVNILCGVALRRIFSNDVEYRAQWPPNYNYN